MHDKKHAATFPAHAPKGVLPLHVFLLRHRTLFSYVRNVLKIPVNSPFLKSAVILHEFNL